VLAGALATLAPIVRLFTERAVPFRGGPRCNWVHALDVARAAAFLVRSPQPHGEAFNVANDDPVGVGDVVTTALRAGGLTLHGPGIPWPTAAVRLAVEVVAGRRTLGVVNRVSRGLFDLATRRAGVTTPLEPRLDAEALGFAVRDVIFDNRKLKSLGFRYRYPRFEEGWAATIAWYRENGWIPAGGDAGDPAPPAPAIARG
jgi:nucleoside-diphosphate-sugar epimerase